MRIGLTGAHRVGKTTLAVELAKELAIKFIRTNVVDYYRQHKIFPNNNIPINKRYEIQQNILTGVENQLNNKDNFITDRTPIDFFSYSLKEGIFPDMYQYLGYRRKCINAMKLFDVVIFVRYGVPIEKKTGVDCSLGSIKSIDSTIDIVLKSFNLKFNYFPEIIYIPRQCIDLQNRIEIVKLHFKK